MSSIDEYLGNQPNGNDINAYFQRLLANKPYSQALKEAICGIGGVSKTNDSNMDFIAHKIVCHQNDDISSFLNELKEISACGYKVILKYTCFEWDSLVKLFQYTSFFSSLVQCHND